MKELTKNFKPTDALTLGGKYSSYILKTVKWEADLIMKDFKFNMQNHNEVIEDISIPAKTDVVKILSKLGFDVHTKDLKFYENANNKEGTRIVVEGYYIYNDEVKVFLRNFLAIKERRFK